MLSRREYIDAAISFALVPSLFEGFDREDLKRARALVRLLLEEALAPRHAEYRNELAEIGERVVPCDTVGRWKEAAA